MNRVIAAVGLSIIFATTGIKAETSSWVEGTHYTALHSGPRAQTSQPGEVQIVEFFSYFCHTCYRLEPELQSWSGAAPEYVHMEHVPVVWDARTRALSRLHYTLAKLGHPELRAELFETIHKSHHKALVTGNETEIIEQQRQFALAHGITDADFQRAFNSPEVLAKAAEAQALMQKYRVDGTPTLVINGQYSVTPMQALQKKVPEDKAELFAPLFGVLDELASREHAATLTTRSAAR